MFSRRLSQKPSKDLLSSFKSQYSKVLPASQLELPQGTAPTLCQTPNLAFDPSHFEGILGRNNGQYSSESLDIPGEFKTAGLLDPNVDAFHDFNQPGGFWPPTPQGSNPFDPGPGQMHAQHHQFGMETPVSGGAPHLGFPSHDTSFPGHEFLPPRRINTFPQTHQQYDPNQTMAPHSFHPQIPHLGHVDPHAHGLHLSDVNLAQGYDQPQPVQSAHLRQSTVENLGPRSVVNAMNQFRFRTILKAQTAMIKHPQDIPVTYLNKSQAYTIQIEDSALSNAFADPALKYRTAIRISFEDEQQRKDPASSWQLWNEGRGTNEAIKRGVKPKAVEYVHQDQSQAEHRSSVQPVTESFDGFSVTWRPSPGGVASCNVQLRFNFLSTDFSHSKGVKGVPVRLCAKTELVEGHQLFPSNAITREICYCAVKIFRDHGAERKLANDKTHIDKLIDKFTAQADQTEAGAKETGKRRRSDSTISVRPSKVAKRRRTWSVSSSGSLEDQHDTAEDELLVRIRSLKAMPNSIRPISAFYLKGGERDDLDAHPVPPLVASPPSEPAARPGPPSLKTDTTQTTSRSTVGLQSETPTSRSPSMMRSKGEASTQLPPPLESTPSYQSKSPTKQERLRTTPNQLASPPSSGPGRNEKTLKPPTSLPVPQLAQALDVDQTYQPPLNRKPKAVAEFFMKPSISWKPPVDDNYRAVYLMQRTLSELVRTVAFKCGIDPTTIISTVRVNDQGLPITAEDDMVEQMPERQDFIAELDVAESTHDSAAQFFDDIHNDLMDTGTKYKLTLRY